MVCAIGRYCSTDCAGDEYEGQIALHKFCHAVSPADVQGRLLVVPTLSMDAALAGTRTWPDSDRTNFNRRFPGAPAGTVAAQLAYYITCYLMPQVDTHARASARAHTHAHTEWESACVLHHVLPHVAGGDCVRPAHRREFYQFHSHGNV